MPSEEPRARRVALVTGAEIGPVYIEPAHDSGALPLGLPAIRRFRIDKDNAADQGFNRWLLNGTAFDFATMPVGRRSRAAAGTASTYGMRPTTSTRCISIARESS